MAGVEFVKYGRATLGEMACHFENDIRMNPRVRHSNLQIDKTQTHQNYYIGASSYQEIVDRIEEVTAETDRLNPPKRVRADRKTSFVLEVSCPVELEGTPKEDEFYHKVYEMYKDYLPGIEGAAIHKDEKHEYYDSRKKEFVVSRNHMHIFGACLTQDGRINCRDLITREMCQRVNDDIQRLCLREWGISYQTGSGRQGEKKTVEQLKSEGVIERQKMIAKENLEVISDMKQEKKTLEAEIEELNELKDFNTEAVLTANKQLDNLNTEIISKNAYNSELEASIGMKEKELERMQSLFEKLTYAIQTLIETFKEKRAKMTELQRRWKTRDSSVYADLLTKAAVPIKRGENSEKTLLNALEEKVIDLDEKVIDHAINGLESANTELDEIEEEYGLD